MICSLSAHWRLTAQRGRLQPSDSFQGSPVKEDLGDFPKMLGLPRREGQESHQWSQDHGGAPCRDPRMSVQQGPGPLQPQ